MLHTHEYAWFFPYLIFIKPVSCIYSALKFTPASLSHTLYCLHAFILRLLLFASISLCNFLYPNTFSSHYVHTQLPSWLSDTLCPPVVCTLWGRVCVLCCHQHVVVHVCVCRLVCSLCIRAWKHVPDLVMPHSQQHPRCVLSIEVRGLLWQVQITVSFTGSARHKHGTAPCM